MCRDLQAILKVMNKGKVQMRRGFKGDRITIMAIIIGGIVSTIESSHGGYNGGNNNYRPHSTFGNNGKGVQTEVLKMYYLVMEVNKEPIGVVIQITELLYLLNVKYALGGGIPHQIVTIELITISHLVDS